MLGQVIVSSVCNTPQLAPAKWELEFQVSSSLAVEAQLFRRMVSCDAFRLALMPNSCSQSMQYCSPVQQTTQGQYLVCRRIPAPSAQTLWYGK